MLLNFIQNLKLGCRIFFNNLTIFLYKSIIQIGGNMKATFKHNIKQIVYSSRLAGIFLLLMMASWMGSLTAYAGTWSNPLNLTIWVGYPVDAAEAQRIRDCMSGTNLVMWDATDGQLRLGTITLTASLAQKNSADIWLFPQTGRAGLSFFLNGSALENDPFHITMFQNSMTPNVMFHELGHYIFGLGDEYTEGATVGNNCTVPGRRIGPCAGMASASLNPTWCIMQANANATEFCVAGNHDPQIGNLAVMDLADYDPAIYTSWNDLDLTQPDVGANSWHAPDFVCIKAYDPVTGNYEATQQSHCHYRVIVDNSTTPPTRTRVPLSCWETIQINRPSLVAPAGNPVDNPPPAPPDITFVNNATLSDKVILIMDRSSSMGWSVADPYGEVCGNGIDDDNDNQTDEAECADAKLHYAKASARGFLDLYSSAGINQVGLHSFSSWAQENRPLSVLQSLDCNDPANAGQPLCLLKTAVDALTASGSTDIYEALQLAYNTLLPVAGNRAVFLLTDGCHNNPGNPADWIPLYTAANIPVYTITVGADVDDDLISDITSSTRGEHIPVNSANDLPAVYAEMAAYMKGEGIILPRTAGKVSKKGSSIIQTESVGSTTSPPAQNTYPLEVTEGSQRLTVFLSNTELRVNNLDTRLTLQSPGNVTYDEGMMQPGVKFVRDPFYMIAEIENPQGGTWQLVVTGSGGVQPYQVLASEFQPQISFRGSAYPRNVPPDKAVMLSAVPAFGRDLTSKKVTINYAVERPDGFVINGVLKWSKALRLWRATFNDYHGGGIYKVLFTVKVKAGATVMDGEPIFGPPSPPVEVKSFTRFYSTSFHVLGPHIPPQDDYNGGIIRDDDPRPPRDEPKSYKGFGLSFHVGSAHPLGNWNKRHDSNIHFHLDLNYKFSDKFLLKLMAGFNQFTADFSSAEDNIFLRNLSLNFQLPIAYKSWLSFYAQGGMGFYWPKVGTVKSGFNLGLGAQLPMNASVVWECGLDYHHIFTKEKSPTRFFVTQLGVIFKF
jgi:hypothetical protein